MPAAPMDAAVAVMLTINTRAKSMLTSRDWAMKMAATASYKAVPSMLIVAPMGTTNRTTCLFILFFSSRQAMLAGNVAVLEAVPKAVNSASDMFTMKRYGFFFVML